VFRSSADTEVAVGLERRTVYRDRRGDPGGETGPSLSRCGDGLVSGLSAKLTSHAPYISTERRSGVVAMSADKLMFVSYAHADKKFLDTLPAS